jgi:hypothetical protein
MSKPGCGDGSPIAHPPCTCCTPAPILIALTMLYRGLPPTNKYGLVALLTVTGLIASYVAADLIRRLPGFRNVL